MSASSDSALVFANLRPLGPAKQVLEDALSHMRQRQDDFHLKFYQRDESDDYEDEEEIRNNPHYFGVPDAEFEGLERDLDAELSELKSRNTFIFSLSDPHPSQSAVGWRVGRGSPESDHYYDNDMLLTRPRDARGSQLAVSHAIFRLDARSGLLGMQLDPDAATMQYQISVYMDDLDRWFKLWPNRFHIFHQRKTAIMLGNLQYEIKYVRPQMPLDRFFQIRASYMKQRTGYALQSLPGNFHRYWPTAHTQPRFETNVYIHHSFSAGGSGWLSTGIELYTSRFLAVKEFHCKDHRLRDIAAKEFSIGSCLPSGPGIVLPIRFWCEHDCPDAAQCTQFPTKLFITFPLGYGSFRDAGHRVLREHPMAWRSVMRSSLYGLCVLHRANLIHRDITARNLLIVSLDPPEPQGAVIDFGTAAEGPHCYGASTPHHLRPPEARPTNNVAPVCDQKIDIWGWARSILTVYGYSDLRSNEYPPDQEYDRVLLFAMQSDAQKQNPALFELLKQMLAKHPAQRPTAFQAYNDPCWEDLN